MFLIEIKFHHIPFIPCPLLLPDALPELLSYPKLSNWCPPFLWLYLLYMCMWVQIFNKYDLLCPLFCLYRYGEHPWKTLIHFLPVKIGTVWLLWFDPGQKSHLVTDGQEVVRNTLIRSLSLVFQFKVQNRPLNCQAESQPGGRKACQNQKWLARAQKQDWDTICCLCQP